MENSVGRPVRGDNFFDRAREQRRVWQRLRTDHVLMLAPRRVGKTSLLLRLADDAEAHGFHAVYLSVADAQREIDLVKKLIDALRDVPAAETALKKLGKGPLKRFFRRAKRIDAGPIALELDTTGADAEESWSTVAESLADALEKLGDKWLLLVDELPIFVMTLLRVDPSGDRARTFLHWFRELRNPSHRKTHMRWVVAGSIGLDAVVAQKNLGDTINDLNPVPLGAFDTETTHAFLTALANSYDITLALPVRERIIERVGWLVPFYLQLLFAKLLELATDEAATPTPALVDRAVAQILSPAYRGSLDYWRQRLTDELGRPDDARATALLNAVCMTPEGASRAVLRQLFTEFVADPAERDDKLRFLLDVLENDGYLVYDDAGTYRFRSALLREFWRARIAP